MVLISEINKDNIIKYMIKYKYNLDKVYNKINLDLIDNNINNAIKVMFHDLTLDKCKKYLYAWDLHSSTLYYSFLINIMINKVSKNDLYEFVNYIKTFYNLRKLTKKQINNRIIKDNFSIDKICKETPDLINILYLSELEEEKIACIINNLNLNNIDFISKVSNNIKYFLDNCDTIKIIHIVKNEYDKLYNEVKHYLNKNNIMNAFKYLYYLKDKNNINDFIEFILFDLNLEKCKEILDIYKKIYLSIYQIELLFNSMINKLSKEHLLNFATLLKNYYIENSILIILYDNLLSDISLIKKEYEDRNYNSVLRPNKKIIIKKERIDYLIDNLKTDYIQGWKLITTNMLDNIEYFINKHGVMKIVEIFKYNFDDIFIHVEQYFNKDNIIFISTYIKFIENESYVNKILDILYKDADLETCERYIKI
jgi:hypothetical protein